MISGRITEVLFTFEKPMYQCILKNMSDYLLTHVALYRVKPDSSVIHITHIS